MVESTVGEPFVDADDIADVAVATLLDPAHIGRIHELTGPRLITFRDIAARDRRAYRTPRRVPGAARGGLRRRAASRRDCPQEDAVGLAYVFDEVLDGRNAHLESGVNDVLGREARDFATFLGLTLARSWRTMDDVVLAGGQALNGLLAGDLSGVRRRRDAGPARPTGRHLPHVMNRISVVIVNPAFLTLFLGAPVLAVCWPLCNATRARSPRPWRP